MKKILFVSLAVVIFFACKKEKASEVKPAPILITCDTTITYISQIKTIIDNNCIYCHKPSNLSGGIDLTTYLNVKVKADDGRINQRAVVEKTMPQDHNLSAADITTISCWIQNGAKE